MAEQNFVDLARTDFLAAANDQLLDAAGECQVAIAVEEALIAGAEPAVGVRLGVGLRIVLVTGHHARALDDHFAALAGCQKRAGLGHAIGFEHRHAEDALHPLHHFRGQGGAAGADETEALGARGPLGSGSRQQQVVDGWNR